MTVSESFPSPLQLNSCGSRGKAPGGTLLVGRDTAVGGGEGLAPYISYLSPCKVDLRKVASP